MHALVTDGSPFPTPFGNPQPTALPHQASTQYIFPPGWGGNIPIGRSIAEGNSLIEGSNNNSQPHIDVSYVNGFSVPITCSSEGKPITGCNIDLFQQLGIFVILKSLVSSASTQLETHHWDPLRVFSRRALVLRTRFLRMILPILVALHISLAVLVHHVRRRRDSQELRQPRVRAIINHIGDRKLASGRRDSYDRNAFLKFLALRSNAILTEGFGW